MKLAIALACAAAWGVMQAQTFEVASVKPAIDGSNGYSGGCRGIDSGPSEGGSTPPLGRCVIHSARLSHLISTAYQLPNMSMLNSDHGPDWVARGAERFDVDAKAENPAATTEAQLLEMLKALLADRFQLKFHREEREIQGFILVVAKNGPKFKESAKDASAPRIQATLKGAPTQSVNAHKGTIATLIDALGFVTQTTVVDRTGLTGEYDFKLSFGGENGPEIFSALPEQLGLKLEGTKVPVSYFVVDSAKRPAAN